MRVEGRCQEALLTFGRLVTKVERWQGSGGHEPEPTKEALVKPILITGSYQPGISKCCFDFYQAKLH